MASPVSMSQEPPRIWDVRAGAFVSESALDAALVRARYRLLGEVHDNPRHHRLRAALLAHLAAAGKHPAIVFEQFDLDHERALSLAQAEGADAERLATAGHLDRKAWRWPLHKPLLDAALEARLPVHAGNLSRSTLAQLAVAARDETAAWQLRLRRTPWSPEQAQAMSRDLMDAHCGLLPAAALPRLQQAQRMRDAAMAEALASSASADGAVLIAGNGHVRKERGVPLYLADAGGPLLSVGFIEVEQDEAHRPELARELAESHADFDYLWLTPPEPREDPCAQLAPVRK